MLTLSFGVKRPQTGDKGTVFWPAMEDNFQQLNDHTHDGSDSSQLTSASVTAATQSISAAGWVANGNTYRQLVTMTVGFNYDDYLIIFRESVTKQQMFLAVERNSATSFYVYCNDNTLDVVAYYIS